MRYLLHNKLTKYMYVHVHYTTAKVNSFFFLLIDLYYKNKCRITCIFVLCIFLIKYTGIHVVYLCNYFKAEIDNWQGDF